MASIESSIRRTGYAVAAAALVLCPEISRADEGGVSFWLPGQYGSLVAVPQTPGWALGVIYYHSNISAFGNVAAARQITVGRIPANVNVNLNLSLSGQADPVILSPTYTFATPVLGGQLSVGVASLFGKVSASIAGTLTAVAGSIVATRSGVLQDSLTSYGDVVPTVTLRWNQGVNNYMVYATGDIPAGDYSATRLANLGIGHGAVDAYTYSIRRRETSSRPRPALPTISRIRTRSIVMASISTSTGAPRTSSRSRFSSALPDMLISRSPMTRVRTRSLAGSGHAF
jgi:hypothetical protein